VDQLAGTRYQKHAVPQGVTLFDNITEVLMPEIKHTISIFNLFTCQNILLKVRLLVAMKTWGGFEVTFQTFFNQELDGGLFSA
jgi:hypothetical protein